MFKNLVLVLTFLCGILSFVNCARTLNLQNGTRALIDEPKMAVMTNYRGNICKKGYVRTPVNIKYCLPYCEGGCDEGYCAAPNQCKCSNVTQLLPNGKCGNTCPRSCLNGQCNGNICICNDGFDMDISGKFCMPRCENRCLQNEACISKNVCDCIKGFKRNPSSRICEPDCGRGCGYGKCVGSNKCQCYPGYKLKNKFCHANCWMNCDHGRCVKDNTCECDPGYVLSLPSLKCVPVCVGCEIGKCVGLDRCECPTGYKYVGNHCKPICNNDCGAYGLCVGPGKCECKKDYLLNQSTNTCVSPKKSSSRKCKGRRLIGCLTDII